MSKASNSTAQKTAKDVRPLGASCYRPSAKNRTEIPEVTKELGDPWSNNSVIDWCVTHALPTLRSKARKMNAA
jgi:hypothetical protein